jgi:hypothetical protein
MRKLLFSAALLLGSIAAAFGQQGSSVTQTATQLNAGVTCQTAANPAVNTQNTLTFSVPAGQYLYLTYLYLNIVADGTGGTPVSIGRFTTTNLASVEWDMSFAGTASTQSGAINAANASGLVKSAVGPVNVTIVSPAAGAHNAYAMTACGFYAQ